MLEAARDRSLLERQALDYRKRAERFRAVAEGMIRPGPRRILLDLAHEADMMAARIEERLRDLQPGQQPDPSPPSSAARP
jgi:hypothetical protein